MNEVTFKEGALSPLKEKKKRRLRGSKLGNFIFYGLTGLLSVLVSFCAGYASQILYCNNSYVHFYVNGMSMYPTLNPSATYRSSNGTESQIAWNFGNFNRQGVYRCDAGLADASTGFLEKIERFSIVSSYYETDYQRDSEGNYILDENGNPVLNSGAGEKIKRVIGMPGESLYFDAQGELHISTDGGETFEVVAQPFLEEQSWWTDEIKNWRYSDASNPYLASADESQYVWTLGDDQYFLCGDNRRRSTDSRGSSSSGGRIGPVSSHCITGLAVVINGEVNYEVSGGTGRASSNIFDLYMPWNYRYL